jgi:hypothetical protein
MWSRVARKSEGLHLRGRTLALRVLNGSVSLGPTAGSWDKAVMCTRHAERQLLSKVDIQSTPMLGHLNKQRLRGKG